jgi:aminoglycoside phosphotransferase family enzyme/predicted kinase
MELSPLIEELAKPAAYPFLVDRIEIRHTHISVAFLAGPFVYKVKKPVDLGFLDFSTLEKRRYFCEEEVRLNRRLAPDVYLGVVPISRTGNSVQVEGTSEVIEWAVKMTRLPEKATLLERLKSGEIDIPVIQALARKIASFHAGAQKADQISAFGRLTVVSQNALDNFMEALLQVGATVSSPVFERLEELTKEALVCLGPLIEARAQRNVPRDTHGDLHLDHVYLFPDKKPPDDLIIIDCIEFNERFRYADPVADMAFLVMDLLFHGRRDLAQEFSEAYFQASGDEEGRALLPFYTAYRAAVRGKVEGIEIMEKEIPYEEKVLARTKARAHWLLALGELERPSRKPCLVLVGGLPGSGKSTLARSLSEQANFTVIRSDVVRKELAQRAGLDPAPFTFGQGIYAPVWTTRTYTECLHRAEQFLFEGRRVLVDATFGNDGNRRTFLEAAKRLRVPGIFLLCGADAEVVRARLARRRGDVSDADWSIYEEAAQRWENPTQDSQAGLREIDANDTPERALAAALDVLRQFNLLDP